ncbi:MAG: glycosyltransferase [Promethearchaeota archaeon]
MIKDHLIIFFPLVDWDAPFQRYQYLARELSRTNKVIYFEPALSVMYFLRKPGLLRRKLLRASRAKKKVARNLFTLNAPPILPYGNITRFINCINQFFLLLLIKIFTMDFRERKRLCLWISDAAHYPLIKWLKPKISVYDCTDAIVFPDREKQDYHNGLRQRTMRDSSVSFFTSQLYFREGQAYSRNCHYVPNGVDVKHFRKTHYRVPEELKKIRRPLLGFVGTLDARMDRELIEAILTKKPEACLVFVGPIADNSWKFENEDRVLLLGKREYEEIPDFVNQFDVALIPYRLYENTQYMYPVKLHEYLVLGKPVVTTDLPEVRQFSDIVYIARNPDEFVEKIEEALRATDEGSEKRRVETALANTWDHRLEMIGRELGKVSEGNPEERMRER